MDSDLISNRKSGPLFRPVAATSIWCPTRDGPRCRPGCKEVGCVAGFETTGLARHSLRIDREAEGGSKETVAPLLRRFQRVCASLAANGQPAHFEKPSARILVEIQHTKPFGFR